MKNKKIKSEEKEVFGIFVVAIGHYDGMSVDKVSIADEHKNTLDPDAWANELWDFLDKNRSIVPNIDHLRIGIEYGPNEQFASNNMMHVLKALDNHICEAEKDKVKSEEFKGEELIPIRLSSQAIIGTMVQKYCDSLKNLESEKKKYTRSDYRYHRSYIMGGLIASMEMVKGFVVENEYLNQKVAELHDMDTAKAPLVEILDCVPGMGGFIWY